MLESELPGDANGGPYRSAPTRNLDPRRVQIPYEGQTRMRLVVTSGLSMASVHVDPHATALLTVVAASKMPVPKVDADSGELRVSAAGAMGSWFRVLFMSGDETPLRLVLHPGVAWDLRVRGGVSGLEGDLSGGILEGLAIDCGCGSIELDLPKPQHRVPIRLAGGATHLRLRRPRDVGVTVGVSGGISALQIDDRHFDSIGGRSRLHTEDGDLDAPRYEVEVLGGAANVEIARHDHTST